MFTNYIFVIKIAVFSKLLWDIPPEIIFTMLVDPFPGGKKKKVEGI